MFWLLTSAGLFLILAGIADVFFTVLHYDGFGFISARLYKGLFRLVRLLTRLLPRGAHALVLSLAAPLMVPITITVWVSLISSGYALIFYAGMTEETFFFQGPGAEPSLADAFYLSGVSIATVGFGNITPADSAYQALAVSEGLIGFGVLTLAVTYVIGVYGVLQQLGVLAAGLYHQASDTGDPLSILDPHFPRGKHHGEPRDLDAHLVSLHRGLVELFEGVRRYPVVYYYHSRRAYRSLPFVFRMMGGMAAALRWGLPAGHPGNRSPWLPTLITGLKDVTAYFDERFLFEPLEEAPKPIPFEAFEAAFSREKEPSDRWLARFLEVDHDMRDLAGVEDDTDFKEAYGRYTDWLPFAFRIRSFYEASARELGYELEDLAHRPGEMLF